MNNPFTFDLDKGIEAVVYLSGKLAEPTCHNISKIIYFASKEHLEKYGRLICGERYVAREYGPVPSKIYDLLKAAKQEQAIADNKTPFAVSAQCKVKSLRLPNLDIFSDSDLECLNNALQKYGSFSFDQLKDLSYDDAWNATDINKFINLEKIIGTLNNHKELIAHLQEPYPGEAE